MPTPRLTADMDLLIGVDDKNTEGIISGLSDFGIKGAQPDFFKKEGNVFRIGRPTLRIEILDKASGLSFEACYKRKKVFRLEGFPVKVISRIDLMKNKAATKRPKDLADIAEFKRIKQKATDH